MTAADPLEPATQAVGRDLFAGIRRGRPLPLTRRWWDDRLMAVSMANEPLKVQLFRFVDTLPYLTDPRDVSRHLREYLTEAADTLPWWARAGTRLLPDGGLGGRLLAMAARANATRMARKFIAGQTADEAVAAVRAMRRAGYTFTLDLLGEATVTEPEADAVAAQYHELLTELTAEAATWPEVPDLDRDDRGPIPRVNLSVKLSALYSQFDPIDPDGTGKAVAARLRPILRRAKESGAFINFDMEQYAFKDATLKIARDILAEPEFRDWPHVGLAIQAYLTDTDRDLRHLLDWAKNVRGTPVAVRLVKGAYWDYETVVAAQNGWPVPVFTQKWQSDAAFEAAARFLLENHDWLTPCFGSHNVRSIAHTIAAADALKVPAKRYEFQMLYGMADGIRDAVRARGRRVRIYTPYGRLLPGMAYLVRRLLENTSNDSFLKQGFADRVSEDVLLRNPSLVLSPSSLGAPMQSAGNGRPPAKDGFRNEPPADFAKEENRAAMRDALELVRNQFGRTYPAVVGGKPEPVVGVIETRNPSRTSEVVGRCGAATADQANRAVAAALAAFDGWRDTPAADRAAFLRRAADVMRARRWELAAWIVHEVGKPWREADADVAEAVDFCEYYAAGAEALDRGSEVDLPGEANAYFYEPRGVAVVIAPWNFPLAILCGMTAAAVATGNTVVMKPAEQSGVVAAKLMSVFEQAGLPDGVVNYLPGVGEEVGPALVGHPDVALIAFTGSLPVALAINEQAARTPPGAGHVKKVIAEMGGKNAVIVDADADLDEAVRGVADAAFGYAGQKCSAGSRAIVLAGIYDQFLARLVEATKSLTVGPADRPGSSLGPVIDADARARIERFVEAGKGEAKLVYRHDVGPLAAEGHYVGPTIFADVPENAAIAQEEIFGPVLAVTKAADLDDALRIANGTKYALTGGVFSRSPANIAAVKKRFRVGNLYVNRKCTGALVHRQPFGGFKLSGIGSKAGGPDYLLQFVVPRTVTENTLRRGFAPSE